MTGTCEVTSYLRERFGRVDAAVGARMEQRMAGYLPSTRH